MFRNAIRQAMEFTRPVVISSRTLGNKCSSGLGSYIVLNRDGYFLTAFHIMAQLQALAAQCQASMTYNSERAKIEADPALSVKERRRALIKLKGPNRDAAQNVSPWWSRDDLVLDTWIGVPLADLAVGHFKSWDPSWVKQYPKLKDPDKPITPGVSLCKLGYPFNALAPIFHENTQSFELPGLQLTYFPIEGMLTRLVDVNDDKDTASQLKFKARMIETSSPGLMGQSGGPTFDTDGTIWAVQSRTMNFPLGFDPVVPGERSRHEHQFLNVGWGVSVETVVPFLRDQKIAFDLASY